MSREQEIPELLTKGIISIVIYSLSILLMYGVTIISTRKLTPENFGLYQFLINFTMYFLILSSALGWISTRFIARKIDVIKISFIKNIYLSLISSLIFFILIFLITITFPINTQLIILAFLFLITMNFFIVFRGIEIGFKPVNAQIGNFFQIFIRFLLLLVLIFILFFKITVELILSVYVISNLSAIFYFYFSLKKFKGEKNEKKFSNFFSKGIFIPIIRNFFSYYSSIFDITIITLILYSTLPVAYFRSAFIICTVITFIRAFSPVVYKRLLEEENKKELETGIKTIFLFSLILTLMIISLGDHLLGILRKEYAQSYYAAIILAIAFLFSNIGHLLSQSILAYEKVDLEEEINIKKIKKSLFIKEIYIIIVERIIQYSILAFLIIFIFKNINEPSQIAFYWSFAWIFPLFISFLLKFNLTKKIYQFKIPLTKVIKYTVPPSISAIIIYFIKPKEILLNFLNEFILASSLVILYLTLTFILLILIEKDIRNKTIVLLKYLKKLSKFR